MSLKGTGTQLPETVGSQGPTFGPRPRPSAFITRLIRPRQAAGSVAANEGFSPEGRKKLTTAAGMNAPAGPAPQPFTKSGLSVGKSAPAATALSSWRQANHREPDWRLS